MLVVMAVMAMKYLVFHFYRFWKYVGTGGRSWFDFPTVPFFIFIKHDAFFFLASNKFVTFDSHYSLIKIFRILLLKE